MKIKNAIRLCALLTLAVIFTLSIPIFAQTEQKKETQTQQTSSTQKPATIRIVGAGMFSFAIITAIVVTAREIRSSEPESERILRKYRR